MIYSPISEIALDLQKNVTIPNEEYNIIVFS